MTFLPRDRYAALYGPTTGDRVRLADTNLVVQIERDLTSPGVPVGLALVIVSILFDQVGALKLRMSVDDEERLSFTMKLR